MARTARTRIPRPTGIADTVALQALRDHAVPVEVHRATSLFGIEYQLIVHWADNGNGGHEAVILAVVMTDDVVQRLGIMRQVRESGLVTVH